jgi:uncharacterized protein YjiS (DUF1127 family)
MKTKPALSHMTQPERERHALSRLRQILNAPGLLRASIIQMNKRCGKPYCWCAKAKRHWHLSWCVGQSQGGSPRMKHIPAELLPEVRLWVKRYQEARKLLDEVSNENWNKIIRHTKKER